MSRPTYALIDTAAFVANYRLARSLAPGARALAVVKANAYGHGAVALARALGDEAEVRPHARIRRGEVPGAVEGLGDQRARLVPLPERGEELRAERRDERRDVGGLAQIGRAHV